jgi:hypothetical protein
VRILLSAAALLVTASCSYGTPWTPWIPWRAPPGQLTLSNYRFADAAVETVVTTAPDCSAIDPAAPTTAFDLPFKGTRVIAAAPDADICWRRKIAGGAGAAQWTDWSRAFTASGRSIDLQL